MIAAINLRQPVSAIIAAIESQLAAIKLADKVTPAFQRIERFDSENLEEAFQFLLITEQRVCVIVPLDERFESIVDNRKLMVKRMAPIALLCGDRVLGNRKKALWGDPNSPTTPGAYGLVELALPAVTGQIIANSINAGGVVSEPSNTLVLTIPDKQKKLPGRVTVVLELHCRGGRLEATYGPGAVF